MYHCVLKIAVFSPDFDLVNLIRDITPLDRFDHAVASFDTFDCRAAADCDILIWNLADAMSPAKVRAACREGAALVFCGDRQAIDGCSEAELEAADEFWERPLNGQYIRYRFGRLLRRIKLEKDLYLTSTYLDTAIDSIPDMVWFKAMDGTHVKVNKAFCTTVGKTREDVTGRDHCYIWDVSKEDFEKGEGVCKETEDAVMRERRTLQFTEMVKSQKGLRQFRTYKSPLFDSDGETILGTVGIGHDVTDLENMSTEIEILLSSMPFAILLKDNRERILNVNARFEEYFGVKKQGVLGRQFDEWNAGAFYEERTVNNEGFVEARVRLEENEGKVLEIHEDSIYDIFHNNVGKICIYRDVTLERQLEEQILRNSNTDFMTGLYNRRSLYQYLHNNSSGKKVSLLYVDLDYFKRVNDTYGHKVGDEALILTAKLLRESFKNDFIARIGGDEFLVVKLGHCEREELERGAQDLIERMKENFGAIEPLSILSASVGIVQSEDFNVDIDLLIQQSDTALYKAKEMGRSRFCVYDREMK